MKGALTARSARRRTLGWPANTGISTESPTIRKRRALTRKPLRQSGRPRNERILDDTLTTNRWPVRPRIRSGADAVFVTESYASPWTPM
jgi:hypothetical protein